MIMQGIAGILLLFSTVWAAESLDDASGCRIPSSSRQPDANRFHIPKLQHIITKFGYMTSWKNQIGTTMSCPGETEKLIQQCGSQDLLAVFIPMAAVTGSTSTSNNSIKKRNLYQQDTSRGEEFKTTRLLQDVCFRYRHYSRCLTGYGITDQCISLPKLINEVLYQYVCGDGRQAFSQSVSCLVRVDTATLQMCLPTVPGCVDVSRDFSGLFRFMMSGFHLHDETPSKSDIILENLKYLCCDWQKLEQCYFPVLGKLCGEVAHDFYTGILKSIKMKLASFYRTLGPQVQDAGQCTNTELFCEQRHHQTMPLLNSPRALTDYISKQLKSWTLLAEERERKTHDKCDARVVYDRIGQCFWTIAKDMDIEHLLVHANTNDIVHSICSVHVPDFLKCYQGYSGSCPFPVDITNATHAICMTARNPMCVMLFLKKNTGLQSCGATLPDITEYIFTRINIASNQECGSTGVSSMTLANDTCIHEAAYNTQDDSQKVQTLCGPRSLARIHHSLQILADFLDRAAQITCK